MLIKLLLLRWELTTEREQLTMVSLIFGHINKL